MIKFIEPSIKTILTKKYIEIYKDVRQAKYPLEHGFLVTKIKFQDYIIHEMLNRPTKVREIINAYTQLKSDKTLQEKALKSYEEAAKYDSFFNGVNRS